MVDAKEVHESTLTYNDICKKLFIQQTIWFSQVQRIGLPTELHQLLWCTGSTLSDEGSLEEEDDGIEILRDSKIFNSETD